MSKYGERITNLKVHNVSKDPSDVNAIVEGFLYFANGGEGYRVEGIDDLRLSPSAARFIGVA